MRQAAVLLCLVPTMLLAQKEFPLVWQAKFTVDPEWNAVSPDLAYLVAGDMSEIEMLDGSTGRTLWTYNFKARHGVKQCEDWIAHQDPPEIEDSSTRSLGDLPRTQVVHSARSIFEDIDEDDGAGSAI